MTAAASALLLLIDYAWNNSYMNKLDYQAGIALAVQAMGQGL